MKSFKGLILGSVASLVTIGAAQAADLPVKAKAVEYMRICSAYGTGFGQPAEAVHLLPGTTEPPPAGT